MRNPRLAMMAGLLTVAGAGAALAQGAPTASPTANGGNSVINNGQGSGTGTASPGPGMTLKEGSNPVPTSDPVADGGNAGVNAGAGSGTGTKEPKGDR
ncbi:hypothetical protein [Methylobacterium sp. J-076]|uniref:hypothetical protein n=1 Tax=Methylobacterium sp. J-076 TaxID=2836655 RepID=UPI001FBBD95F|nr:hypothetical protein [Methylobacterium sp. J-076]MCJ2014783.1 hypothetical protein [Methylobacterium sp. J-076]